MAQHTLAMTLNVYVNAPMPKMLPLVQNELARDRFILVLTPRELRVQTQLAHPTTLNEALELATEREILGSEIDADVMTPTESWGND